MECLKLKLLSLDWGLMYLLLLLLLYCLYSGYLETKGYLEPSNIMCNLCWDFISLEK